MSHRDELSEGEILRRDVAEKVLGFRVEKIKPDWYPIEVLLFFRPGNPLVEYSLDARACNATMYRNGVSELDGYAPSLPLYDSEIDAAWEVVEEMRAGGWDYWVGNLNASTNGKEPHGASFYMDGAGVFEAESDSAPRAICLAALKAVTTLAMLAPTKEQK